MQERQLSYELFVLEQSTHQAELEMFIDECILMSESKNSIENICLIQESFAEKVKETIKKLLASISKMWAKFLEGMNTLLKNDKAYLEKYKDIILKKRPVEANYTMYEYNRNALLTTVAPSLNLTEMDSILVDEDTFITKKFPEFIKGAKSPFDMNSLAKAVFRNGDEKMVKSTQLNMTDMYNYCLGYKKLEEVIKKDLTSVNKTSLDVMNKIDALVRSNKIQKESAFIIPNPKYYSSVYESYIHEEDKRTEPTAPTPAANPNPAAPKTANPTPASANPEPVNRDVTGGKAATNTGATGDPTPASGYKSTEKGEEQDLDENKTAKELSDKANVYIKVCGEFVAAKQTIAEEIYKTYMSIIRAHVRDHVGTKDKDANKVKDVATDGKPTPAAPAEPAAPAAKNDDSMINLDGKPEFATISKEDLAKNKK